MDQESKVVDKYHELKSKLESLFSISDYKLINYGLQFGVSKNNINGIIRIFLNNKGIFKIDFSQIKNEDFLLSIKSTLEDNNAHDSVLPKDKSQGFEIGYPLIGTDESGKGDYFGPLVTAGVYVDEVSAKTLVNLGIKDSKKLSDKRIAELSPKVKSVCNNNFSIIEISPETYNKLYSQFKSENKNLNTLLAWGHAKAIEEILGKINCNLALSDQFANEKFILDKLQEKGKKIKLVQMHKAEQNVAVAAASILARERFVKKLSLLSETLKIDIPKGASTNSIQIAKEIVNKFGADSLSKYAKIHFKTTQQIL